MTNGKTQMYWILKRMGVKQVHVSSFLNIHNVRLSRLLHGHQDPSMHEAKLLTRFFDKPESELFAIKEN